MSNITVIKLNDDTILNIKKTKSKRYEKMANMAEGEYICSYYCIENKKLIVHVGMDDYGQCYFLKFTEKDGKEREIGCGTYNFDYEDCVSYTLECLYKRGYF